MKKILLISAFIAAIQFPVRADICSDITSGYTQQIQRLQRDTDMALSLTTDPLEQQGIRASFQMQLSALEAERDAALSGASCLLVGGTTTPPPSGNPPPPPPSGNPPPVVGENPPPTDNPPPVIGGTPGGNSDTCASLKEKVRQELLTASCDRGNGHRMHIINAEREQYHVLCERPNEFGQAHHDANHDRDRGNCRH